jgi:hypothetical protein
VTMIKIDAERAIHKSKLAFQKLSTAKASTYHHTIVPVCMSKFRRRGLQLAPIHYNNADVRFCCTTEVRENDVFVYRQQSW